MGNFFAQNWVALVPKAHSQIHLWESALRFGPSCPIVAQFGPQVFCGKFPRNFWETARAAAGRTPKLENGLLRTAPINPGAKTNYRKVPSDLGCLAPLWCNLAAHKLFAGNFPETSRKLPGRQPAAPQNLGMDHCAP